MIKQKNNIYVRQCKCSFWVEQKKNVRANGDHIIICTFIIPLCLDARKFLCNLSNNKKLPKEQIDPYKTKMYPFGFGWERSLVGKFIIRLVPHYNFWSPFVIEKIKQVISIELRLFSLEWKIHRIYPWKKKMIRKKQKTNKTFLKLLQKLEEQFAMQLEEQESVYGPSAMPLCLPPDLPDLTHHTAGGGSTRSSLSSVSEG